MCEIHCKSPYIVNDYWYREPISFNVRGCVFCKEKSKLELVTTTALGKTETYYKVLCATCGCSGPDLNDKEAAIDAYIKIVSPTLLQLEMKG